jgi:sterol desaturase/sphingolipid hydroxylase (fatty acid hydroxylase superfamily)
MDFSALDFQHHRGWLTFFIFLLMIGEFFWLRYVAMRGEGESGRHFGAPYDRPYDLRESLATVGMVIGQTTIRAAVAPLLAPVYHLAAQHRLVAIDMQGVLPWLALIVLVDFLYYWFHRASHTVAAFWASHSVHHSSARFNLSAAYRLGWTNVLSGGWLVAVLPILIGFPPLIVVLIFGLNLTYQLFLHTTLVGSLGPLEWVFNTPSHHRVHHATNAVCIDRNFGGLLIVFDRLFGTFATAPRDEALRYGTQGRQLSYNPLKIAFGGWMQLFAAMRQAGSVGAAAKLLFGRPV